MSPFDKQAAEMSVSQVAELLEQHQASLQRTADLERQLWWYQRLVWGQLSERRAAKAADPEGQLNLGEDFLDVDPTPPSPDTTVREYERKQRRKKPRTFAAESEGSLLKFGPEVPIEDRVLPNPEIEGIDPANLTELPAKITYRLAQRSAYYVVRYIQKVFKINDTGKIASAVCPPYIIRGSSADVSFLASLLTDKFQWHLPLHRIHQRLQAGQIYLDRSTLTRHVHRMSEILDLIYGALFSSVLGSSVLAVDESPTPCGRVSGKIKTGYFWAFCGDSREVYYLFSPSRSQNVLREALEGYQGTLISDGYAAYESFCRATEGVEHAQCWAHTRRKFVESEDLEPDRAAKILDWIQQLYHLDGSADLGSGSLKRIRKERARPIVAHLFAYLRHEYETSALPPSNPFVKALRYALERQHQLSVFLENEDVPMDTNHVERALRMPVVGRKNWMFNVTEVGARCAAIYYSLIQSCVMVDVNPSIYLQDVLQRIDTHKAFDIHHLIPRLWKERFADNPLIWKPE